MVSELLLAINEHIYVEGVDDECMWKFDPSGNFSVSSFSLQAFKDIVGASQEWIEGKKGPKGACSPSG